MHLQRLALPVFALTVLSTLLVAVPEPVAQETGPVILDDALGYSDPERLKEMGAVLSVASRHAQVILLTSVPDRYLHVGGAQVHRLE